MPSNYHSLLGKARLAGYTEGTHRDYRKVNRVENHAIFTSGSCMRSLGAGSKESDNGSDSAKTEETRSVEQAGQGLWAPSYTLVHAIALHHRVRNRPRGLHDNYI